MNDQKENEGLEQEAVAAEAPEEGASSAEEVFVSETSADEGEEKRGKKKKNKKKDKKGKKKDKKKDKKKGKKKGKKK